MLKQLNKHNPVGLPHYVLKLKKNSIFICFRNLMIKDSLCNGKRLIVKRMENNVLKCQILTGDCNEKPFVFQELYFDESTQGFH